MLSLLSTLYNYDLMIILTIVISFYSTSDDKAVGHTLSSFFEDQSGPQKADDIIRSRI